MTRRLVVIGNGMAATRLVQRLVERDPARFAITVVGDEPHPAYNRIQLSPLLAGEKTAAQIPLRGMSWCSPPVSGPLSRRCRALIVRRLCPSALWRTWNVFWRYPARRW